MTEAVTVAGAILIDKGFRMQGKVAKSARKELVVPYKCYRTGVYKELRSAFPIVFSVQG